MRLPERTMTTTVTPADAVPTAPDIAANPRADQLFAAVCRRLEAHRHIPNATYRIQFNRFFTFEHVREQIAYLHKLGISDLYASPYFAANPESMHGYDVVNHNELNPEVGSWQDYS